MSQHTPQASLQGRSDQPATAEAADATREVTEWFADFGLRDSEPAKMEHLPEHVIQHIMLYLDPEIVARCMVVNSSWLQLLSQNAVWKPLCKMALRQNRDPAAVTNFKSKVRRLASWRHAYLRIPQVRFTGVYSLEHSYVRQGIRDIWHDFEGILQVNYQRTVWFHNDGTCHYVMVPGRVEDSVRHLRSMHRSKYVKEGYWRLEDRTVFLNVPCQTAGVTQEWHLELENHGRAINNKLVCRRAFLVVPGEDGPTAEPMNALAEEAFHFRRIRNLEQPST